MMRIPNSAYLVHDIFILCCSITVLAAIGCSNDAGNCIISGSDTQQCQISSTDTNLIQELFETCLSNDEGRGRLELEIVSGAEDVTLTVNNLPDNFRTLEITNSNSEKCNVQTDTINEIITDIYFRDGPVYVMQNDFFSYFPNLEYVYLDDLVCDSIPIMANNPLLIEFEVYQATILNESSRVLDKSILRGLNKLEYFSWDNGGVTRVERDAFEGLSEIFEISLDGNEIRELFDCTFEGLDKLECIVLSNNGIITVGPYAFLGINNLAILYINENPEFPLSTLTTMNSILEIYINGHTGIGLTAELIEQFPKLVYLGLKDVMLNCTCEYQWIAILSTGNRVFITTDEDSLCIGTDLRLEDPSVYSECVEKSYPCLDQSFVCPGDNTWYKVDTEDGCNCTYPPERAFYNDSSFVCSDINECEDSSTTCQGNCTNTLGSYTCDCHEGFVNLNETFCNDVNECEVDNGGCEHNCINSIGSFNCSCFEGFNISTTNSSACEFIDIPQILNFGVTEFILVVYGVIVFVLLILLVLVIILLLFCFVKRRSSHIPTQAPGYNPTFAELDKMKVRDSTVIENPLSGSRGSSLEPLKDAKASPHV